jgi:hypothetical protein
MSALKIILASTLILASAGAASAGGDTWRQRAIDDVQAREARQIEDGRYNGNLTRREYRQLQGEQARIADLERQAKSDGYVSKREFRAIRDAQADASDHIKSESTDGQKSFWRRWLYQTR